MGMTAEQALDCFASHDLIGLGMEADAVRRRLHPEGVVSYALVGVFHVERSVQGETTGLIEQRVRDILQMGGTGVTLSSLGPRATLDEYVGALGHIKRTFADVFCGGPGASEIVAAAARSGIAVTEAVLRLRDAGMETVSGSDAGILDDGEASRAWLQVHREAHRLGLRTSAGMCFGGGETASQRVAHLETLRRLQEETGGFIAFAPTTWNAQHLASGRMEDEATAVEYLTTLAIARMALDTIENVESDWATQGTKVLQMGLCFGANDVGSILAGTSAGSTTTEEDIRRIVRDAGLQPVQRDAAYRIMMLA